MSNLEIYERVRTVPPEAQRRIEAGRLKGKTDINPMWRIKTLTEVFGPCGIGWKPIITNKWLEKGAEDEVAAFVDIDLYVRDPQSGVWSEAIPGTGGSMFVSSEKNGLYTDDEAYKKAYTDAISVACKALGIGADVYWSSDSSKYNDEDLKGEGSYKISVTDITQSPEPPEPEITLEQALAYTTTGGKKFSDFTDEQLNLIIGGNNKIVAKIAELILEHRKQDKDRMEG